MSYEGDEDDADDYITQVDDIFHRGVEKLGVKFIHQLAESCLADEDLEEFWGELQTAFRRLLLFAEKKGMDIFSNLSVSDFDQFGFPTNNSICFSGLMTAIYNNDCILGRSPSVDVGDDKYAEDEFEDDTEDVSDLCNSQSKSGEVIVEDWEGDETLVPSPSAEPKPSYMHQNSKVHVHSAVGVGAKGVPVYEAKHVLVESKDGFGGVVRSSSGGRRKNPGWITDKKWTLSDKIGEGAFGEVFKCLDNMGRIFAVKVQQIAGKQEEIKTLANEINLMKDLDHPNIVKYIGCKVDDADQKCYIFQQYCSGGSIAHVLETMQKGKAPVYGFSEGIIRNYTLQILSGLCYLHENHIIHRDIKGGNILLDTNGVVKLADFGCSTATNQMGETILTRQMIGSPYFMAPEVFAQSSYGRRGDVWAVGCTIIQMVTGQPPWKDRKMQLFELGQVVVNWSGGPPPVLDYAQNPPISKEISRPLREMLEMCFIKDAKARPFPAEVLNCDFLTMEGLEDSADYRDENVDGFADRFEESISIEEQLHRASSRQGIGAPQNLFGVEEDSISDYINKRLPGKGMPQNSRYPAVPARPAFNQVSTPSSQNPFARGASHSPNPGTVSPAAASIPPVSSFAVPASSAAVVTRPNNRYAQESTSLPAVNPFARKNGSNSTLPVSSPGGSAPAIPPVSTSAPPSRPTMRSNIPDVIDEVEIDIDATQPPPSARAKALTASPRAPTGMPSAKTPRDGNAAALDYSPRQANNIQSERKEQEGSSLDETHSQYVLTSSDPSMVSSSSNKLMRPSSRSTLQPSRLARNTALRNSIAKVETDTKDADDGEFEDGSWKCLSCGNIEAAGANYCSICAVRKGATGKKGLQNQIFYSPN